MVAESKKYERKF